MNEPARNPPLFLSVQKGEDEIVRALDKGANDFLSKPFRVGELMARIRSAIRNTFIDEEYNSFVFGDLEVDFASRTVRKSKEYIKLTATEYNLLLLFVKNEGKVLTHQYLLRAVWGPGYINQSQYLRVFIAQIRKKIEDDPNRPQYILTESGVGYRFYGQL